MGKFYKGNIILGYSQNVVCLVIKKKQGQSINTEHQKMNSALTLVINIDEYMKQYLEHSNMNSETITHSFEI